MYKRDETGKSKQDNEKHRVKWKKHGRVECVFYIFPGVFLLRLFFCCNYSICYLSFILTFLTFIQNIYFFY